MADRAPWPAIKDRERESNGKLRPKDIVLKAESLKDAAARLYGIGFKRPQVAAAMAHVLTEDGNVKVARRKLARWEQEQGFRDLLWRYAVVKADLATPDVLAGVTRAAKRGRVDAAKLILGVTDRYTDKSDMPTEVTIRLDPIPRPELKGREDLPPKEIEASTTDGDS